jgi:hypothetical protein
VNAAEELYVLYVQQQLPFRCQLHQGASFGNAQGQGIFHNGVDPGLQGGTGDGRMIPIDGANKHQIQRLLAEQGRPVGIGRRPKLGGKSSTSLRGSASNCHNLHLPIFAQGFCP